QTQCPYSLRRWTLTVECSTFPSFLHPLLPPSPHLLPQLLHLPHHPSLPPPPQPTHPPIPPPLPISTPPHHPPPPPTPKIILPILLRGLHRIPRIRIGISAAPDHEHRHTPLALLDRSLRKPRIVPANRIVIRPQCGVMTRAPKQHRPQFPLLILHPQNRHR